MPFAGGIHDRQFCLVEAFRSASMGCCQWWAANAAMARCSCPLSGGHDNSEPITAKRKRAQRCQLGTSISLIGSFLSDHRRGASPMKANRGEPMVGSV